MKTNIGGNGVFKQTLIDWIFLQIIVILHQSSKFNQKKNRSSVCGAR